MTNPNCEYSANFVAFRTLSVLLPWFVGHLRTHSPRRPLPRSLFCRCVRDGADYSEGAAFDQATAVRCPGRNACRPVAHCAWLAGVGNIFERLRVVCCRCTTQRRRRGHPSWRWGWGQHGRQFHQVAAGSCWRHSRVRSTRHLQLALLALECTHPWPVPAARLLLDACCLTSVHWNVLQLGDFGQSFVHDATEVVASVDAGTTNVSAAEAFEAASLHVQRLHEIVTELEHRDTCYTLYRFMWDIKEEAELLSMFVQHSLAEGKAGSGKRGFSCHHHQPGTYRGGVVAMVQRLLVQDPHTGVFKAAATLGERPNTEGV